MAHCPGTGHAPLDDSSGLQEIALRGKGDFFGDRSLVRDEPRPVTVMALDEVEAYTVGRELFQESRTASIPFINRILDVYNVKNPVE